MEDYIKAMSFDISKINIPELSKKNKNLFRKITYIYPVITKRKRKTT